MKIWHSEQERKLCLRNSLFLILGFHCDVDETCALLGCHAASCGNRLPTFLENILVPSSRAKRLMKLSQNVGKQSPHNAAQHPRRAQISNGLLFSFFMNSQHWNPLQCQYLKDTVKQSNEHLCHYHPEVV